MGMHVPTEAKVDAKETLEQLKDAFDANDYPGFHRTYLHFLKQFPAFNQIHTVSPSDEKFTNPIFGVEGSLYYKRTSDAEGLELLANGRKASKLFGKLAVEERLEFLNILEKKIRDHAEEIKLTITADTGKPIKLSESEMQKGNEWFQFARDELVDQLGDKQVRNLTLSTQPLGLAQIIGAFNYPYALAIGGIIGALGAGNAIVVASPQKAPCWVFPFMAAAQEAVDEFSALALEQKKPWAAQFAAVKDHLIRNSTGICSPLTNNADLVHFVGGDKVGGIISKARGPEKKTILELGGTNFGTVMASALELEGGAKKIAQTIYDSFSPASGQRCTSLRDLLVQAGAESVVEHLGELCDAGPKPGEEMGNPFGAKTSLGPMVDGGAHRAMRDAIELANLVKAPIKGRLQTSDNIIKQALSENTYWVNPIMIDWSRADPKLAEQYASRIEETIKTEIFGPIIHVLPRFNTLQEAIDTTNQYDTHGLAGALFTSSTQDKYGALSDEARFREGTNVPGGARITSLSINEGTKDRSPYGYHGHHNHIQVGGPTHFTNYASGRTVARNPGQTLAR